MSLPEASQNSNGPTTPFHASLFQVYFYIETLMLQTKSIRVLRKTLLPPTIILQILHFNSIAAYHLLLQRSYEYYFISSYHFNSSFSLLLSSLHLFRSFSISQKTQLIISFI